MVLIIVKKSVSRTKKADTEKKHSYCLLDNVQPGLDNLTIKTLWFY
jgi:hypothetical protein